MFLWSICVSMCAFVHACVCVHVSAEFVERVLTCFLHYYVFAAEWTTCYWVCTSLDQYQYNYPYGQPAEQTCSLDSVERADAVKMANIGDVNRPNGNHLTPHSLGFPQVEQPFPLAA